MAVSNPVSAVPVKGTSTTLGFFGATPVAQPAAPTQPATTASTQASPFGYTTQAQADNISSAVHTLVAVLSAALGGDGITA